MTQKFFFRHHKKKIFFFLTKKKKKNSRRVTKKKNFFFSTFRQSADSRPTGADTVDLEPCYTPPKKCPIFPKKTFFRLGEASTPSKKNRFLVVSSRGEGETEGGVRDLS